MVDASPRGIEYGSRMALALERDARLVREAQEAFMAASGLSRESLRASSPAMRDAMNRRWNASSEKARLDVALARVDDLPCAEWPLTSYRYAGDSGPVMIGAASVDDALREAARSIDGEPDRARLAVWDWPSKAYVPIAP